MLKDLRYSFLAKYLLTTGKIYKEIYREHLIFSSVKFLCYDPVNNKSVITWIIKTVKIFIINIIIFLEIINYK